MPYDISSDLVNVSAISKKVNGVDQDTCIVLAGRRDQRTSLAVGVDSAPTHVLNVDSQPISCGKLAELRQIAD